MRSFWALARYFPTENISFHPMFSFENISFVHAVNSSLFACSMLTVTSVRYFPMENISFHPMFSFENISFVHAVNSSLFAYFICSPLLPFDIFLWKIFRSHILYAHRYNIFSYNSGFNDITNICITVATSIIPCPTIIGSGFLFL